MNSKVFIVDDLPPQDIAMVQALYSRSPKSVTEHLAKVAEVGTGKFMEQYYVQYGHKSIGDCGTTTIFVEQCSMLAAKVIQDWPLYSGQEASTRYLDMSKQEVMNPFDTAEGKMIQDNWMNLYSYVLEAMIPYLKEQFPRKDDQAEIVYQKAIKARAFDVARGFLPAGVTTLVSWHTNLRQAQDHLQRMVHHPLPELRALAADIHRQLVDKYPSSFSHRQYIEIEEYIAKCERVCAYYDPTYLGSFYHISDLILSDICDLDVMLETRPPKAELPQLFRKFGTIKFSFPLDFGSFRDIQRHRSGVMMMPLLSTRHGFFDWYLDQLSPQIRETVKAAVYNQAVLISRLPEDIYQRQYYTAMGYTCACEVTLPLPAAVYLAELRSSQTVHPTLRKVAQQMGEALHSIIPNMALHVDYSPDTWSIKRGNQDIVQKP